MFIKYCIFPKIYNILRERELELEDDRVEGGKDLLLLNLFILAWGKEERLRGNKRRGDTNKKKNQIHIYRVLFMIHCTKFARYWGKGGTPKRKYSQNN